MKIIINKCLLSAENGVTVDGVAIGALIGASGRRHLWEQRRNAVVDVIVVHYTSAVVPAPDRAFNKGLILKIFCDYGVSSHYLIGRRGGVDLLVPEEMKAWHAGGSIMPEPDNRQGVNEFSIGIELLATPTSGFAPSQYRSLSRLCADIEQRHCRRFTYVGHDRIAGERAVALGLRKDAKADPGALFDWDRFLQQLEAERTG